MKTKVVTLDAKAAGEIELSDDIFGLEPRADLIQRVIVWQLAKRRAGTHDTKEIGEIFHLAAVYDLAVKRPLAFCQVLSLNACRDRSGA